MSQQEVDKFAAEAAEWWRNDGPALPLHAMNELRVPVIRNALTGYPLEETGPLPTPDIFPLAGHTIVDVGCGPGILCEVGIRASPHPEFPSTVYCAYTVPLVEISEPVLYDSSMLCALYL